MAETADFSPGDWKGFDFSDARKSYDAHASRSYATAKTTGVKAADLVPKKIQTDSESPLIVACDVTGSMGAWPATIFSKLPYLDIEGKEYLGPNMEISFAAIGDHTMGDQYPLQVRDFDKGTALAEHLKKLIVEGKGGGDQCESYELVALYYARNASMPKATKPIFIIIGDEGLHPFVTKADARANHIEIEGPRIDTTDIFAELKRKFSVYVIRKPYDQLGEAGIHRQWVSLLDAEHVVMLPSPDRVVDVIFGILAHETGKTDYFRGEIEGRQTAPQVATVYKSLQTLHLAASNNDGKSRMNLPKGKKTKLLPPPIKE